MSESFESPLFNKDWNEGSIYRFVKGKFIELKFDPDNMTKKLHIPEKDWEIIVEMQTLMKKELAGYKPDINLVGAAMLRSAAEIPDITDKIRAYALSVYSNNQAKKD